MTSNDECWTCLKCTLSNPKKSEKCNACHSHKHKLSSTTRFGRSPLKNTIDLTVDDESDISEERNDDEVEIILASTMSVRKRRSNSSPCKKPRNDQPQVTDSKVKVQKTLFGNTANLNKSKHHKMKEDCVFDHKTASNDFYFSKKKRPRNEFTNSEYSTRETKESIVNDTKVSCSVDHSNSTLKSQINTSCNFIDDSFNYAQRHDRAMRILSNTFGIQTLRNLQPQAVECALRGQSQIIIMATGGGKSLCYQLPALTLPGITIVVCPLIALMMDQVEGLKQRGVEAAFISSSQSEKENNLVIQRLQGHIPKVEKEQISITPPESKPIKLLYCTPELLQTDRFRTILTTLYQQKKLALLAIDEAHCVSTWGADFRPAYRNLTWLRDTFPDVPCMACTATATKKVIDDIRSVLRMTNGESCHKSTFNRENIHYEVRYKESFGGNHLALQDLMKYVKEQHEIANNTGALCNGIIYVHKRQDTTEIADMLTKIGIPSSAYHAGLTKKQRNETQIDWTSGKVKVAIATVAFGMGIDLAHVRYVVHWSMPKTVEGFLQESGRAGRDGLKSTSLLYFSNDEASKYAFLIRKAAEEKAKKSKTPLHSSDDHHLYELQKIVDYCKKLGCRRKYLLNHFGEVIEPKQVCRRTCDYCINPTKVIQAQESMSNSKAIRDVISQKFSLLPSKPSDWFLDDMDDDYFEDPGPVYDTDLAITSSDYKSNSNMDDIVTDPNKKIAFSGFSSAKSILEKYEAKECMESNGFVKFQAKKQTSIFHKQNLSGHKLQNGVATKSSSATIPSHIYQAVKSKMISFETLPKATEASLKDFGSTAGIAEERKKVQADLDAIRRRRNELLSIRNNR